jgi:periplasmic protein TonB
MGSYIEQYPVFQMPGSRVASRTATIPAGDDEKRFSGVQGKEAGDIFYIVEARPRNLWATAGSLAFQSVLLAAIIIIPLYHTEILPKMATMTMLYAPPAPPPPAASHAMRLRTPELATTFNSKNISLPTLAPKTQEAPATSDGMVGGVIGGVPGGVIGGVPGGVLGQVLGSTGVVPVLAKASAPASPKRVRLAQRVVEANLIHDVAPTYPTEAGRARIQGTVVLWAVIGKDGNVQDVRVESGLPLLAQAAIDAVKQWRYKPYMLNGEPVEVDSRITINFTLSS